MHTVVAVVKVLIDRTLILKIIKVKSKLEFTYQVVSHRTLVTRQLLFGKPLVWPPLPEDIFHR